VSGVVAAAFAVTYAASLVAPAGAAPAGGGRGLPRPGVVEVLTAGVPAEVVAPLLTDGAFAIGYRPGGPPGDGAALCAALARMTTDRCSPAEQDEIVVTREGLDDLDPGVEMSRIYVPTEGGAAAERVRTQAAVLVPNALVHKQQDRIDWELRGARTLAQLTRVFWMFVLVVAACSLTVGTLAALIERRRPFALLRASGLRPGELRRVVFLETAAAMLITALVGVGLGLASSYALAVFRDVPWTWPDAGVFATVAAGVLVSLALTTLALPLIDAATRHDAVRFE
jgi:hypothetical protein